MNFVTPGFHCILLTIKVIAQVSPHGGKGTGEVQMTGALYLSIYQAKKKTLAKLYRVIKKEVNLKTSNRIGRKL